MINQDNKAWTITKSFGILLTQLSVVCVYVDYQGFDSGAESSVLTLLLAESRL